MITYPKPLKLAWTGLVPLENFISPSHSAILIDFKNQEYWSIYNSKFSEKLWTKKKNMEKQQLQTSFSNKAFTETWI